MFIYHFRAQLLFLEDELASTYPALKNVKQEVCYVTVFHTYLPIIAKKQVGRVKLTLKFIIKAIKDCSQRVFGSQLYEVHASQPVLNQTSQIRIKHP